MLTDGAVPILIVEDEKKLAESIGQSLTRAGYAVSLAFDGEAAISAARAQQPALIVLDLNLPKRSGYEVLSTLREEQNAIPVLILSAMDRVEDRVRGLQEGADDYLVKPFDTSELIARIEALLRRAGKGAPLVYRAGDLVLDVLSRKVTRAGVDLALSPKQFALLEFFLRNKGEILTRRRIAEGIWGYTFDTGTNIVDVHINNLRKAIHTRGSKKLIYTIRKEGYVLRDA